MKGKNRSDLFSILMGGGIVLSLAGSCLIAGAFTFAFKTREVVNV